MLLISFSLIRIGWIRMSWIRRGRFFPGGWR